MFDNLKQNTLIIHSVDNLVNIFHQRKYICIYLYIYCEKKQCIGCDSNTRSCGKFTIFYIIFPTLVLYTYVVIYCNMMKSVSKSVLFV